jgi:oligopeptide transport system substrate-binding protein
MRSLLPGLLILFLLGPLCGCAPVEPRADLVIVNGQEPESLDPAIVTGQADLRVVSGLFEGLTRYDPRDATPIPALAEHWDLSTDGRVYTFHLRRGLQWSTGEPLTAHDIVYSWLRVLNPATAADYVAQLYYLEGGEDYATGKITDPNDVGVRALDDLTLRVELVNPTPFFLDLCAFQTLAVVPRRTIEEHGDRWLMARPLPSSGAFELVAWRLNDKIRLRRNPRYWDAENVRSEVIDLLPCANANTALNLYESGAADIVWDKELIPPDLIDALEQRPDFHRFDYLGIYFYRYNVTREPFDDVRVRKALALAIDRRRIVDKITRAGEKPTSEFVPPGVANYESPEGLPYDPEGARQLLAEAGFPGGRGFPRFDYLFNNVDTHEKIAVELQDMWRRELGIQVELRKLEWKVYLNAQSELDYHLSRSSWIGDYNDANTFLELFTSQNGNNRTGWSNARYDELLDRANRLLDPAQRRQLLQEAESLLIREALPLVPLYVYVGMEYYDPDVIKGIHDNIRAEHPLWSIYRAGAPDGR